MYFLLSSFQISKIISPLRSYRNGGVEAVGGSDDVPHGDRGPRANVLKPPPVEWSADGRNPGEVAFLLEEKNSELCVD